MQTYATMEQLKQVILKHIFISKSSTLPDVHQLLNTNTMILIKSLAIFTISTVKVRSDVCSIKFNAVVYVY